MNDTHAEWNTRWREKAADPFEPDPWLLRVFPLLPENPDFVLRPGELPDLFAGWDILLHEEGSEPAKKGGSLAGIVARRPA